MSLRERLPLIHKAHKTCHSREPKEGEIVIVKEDNVPRSSWKLGRVTRFILGQDSKIRSAEKQFSSKNTICRAINYLYPLELPMYENSKERLIECRCNEELPKTDEQRLGVDNRDNNEEVATVLGRRKASLKDNCCVITFCFSREYQEDI